MLRNVLCLLLSSIFIFNASLTNVDFAASLRLSARPFACTAYSDLAIAGDTANSFEVRWIFYKDGEWVGDDYRVGGSGKTFSAYKEYSTNTYYGYWEVDSYNWAYTDTLDIGKRCHESIWY